MKEHKGLGKIIVLGEHAVVHGSPAICGALPVGARVRLMPGDGRLRVPAWKIQTRPASELLRASSDEGLSVLESALRAVLRALAARISLGTWTVDFEVLFDIPLGAGIGGSAALSAALVRALLDVLKVPWVLEQEAPTGVLALADVFALVQESEQVFHGVSSGLDAMLSLRGGFGVFSTQPQPSFQAALSQRCLEVQYLPLQGLSTQKRSAFFWPFSVTGLPMCIGFSGQMKDTKTRVQRILQRLDSEPAQTQALLDRIRGCVLDGVHAVHSYNWSALGECMNQNHALLQKLEVSNPTLDRMCDAARTAGALGAKLTGGGGGGCVIALAPGSEEAVLSIWLQAGYEGKIFVL